MEIKGDLGNFEDSKELSKKFKYKVFYVLDKMISTYHNSFLVDISFLVIQTFQLMGLIEQPWMRNSSITSKILEFMQYFLIVPYLINNGFSSQFQVLLYLCFAFLLVLTMCFLSTSMLIQQNGETNQKLKISHKIVFSSMDFLVNLTNQVLYIPFFQLFTSTCKCEQNANNKYSSTESQNTYFNIITKDYCFSAIKVPSFILSILSLALLHFFCSYINSMYFDSRLNTGYKNSRLNGKYELHLQYFVSYFCIVAAFFFEESQQPIKIEIFSIVINHFFFQRLRWLLYYFRLHQLVFIITFFLEALLLFFFWVVGIIFLTIFNFNYEPITNEICAANSSNYQHSQDALQQLRILCFAVQNYYQYSLKVDGFLNRHRNNCNLTSCPCRSNSIRLKKYNRMLTNQTNNEDLIMSIFVIHTIFNNNILKFGGSNQIRLLYALFLLETIQNKDQALIQLSFLMLNQPTLEEEFIVFRLKKIIMQIQNQKDYKRLDFSSEFSTEDYSTKFKKIINAATKNQLHFWQELQEKKPQADNLIIQGDLVLQQIEDIQNQFEHLTQSRSINQSALRFYQDFSLNILQNKEHYMQLQSQTISQIEQLGVGGEDDMKYEEIYSQGIVVISSQEENFSNILEVNSELLKMIGLTKSQILQKNISFLIPNIWQQHHNQFIDHYLATGQKKIIGQQRDLFLKGRQDYSLPINLNIKTIPSNSQGMLFQASIIARNLLYDYPAFIITQVNGKIDSISPSVIPLFNIDMKKVKQGIYIEKIIPNFWEYIFEFQQKQGKELIIKTYQINMMKECLAKIQVEQIKFMNLASQGYIINIKLCKSEPVNQQGILTKSGKQLTVTQNQYQKYSSQNVKRNSEEEENTFNNNYKYNDNSNLSQNSNYTQNRSTSNSSVIQKQFNKIEIFYDLRTNSYLAAKISLQQLNQYIESESDPFLKIQQKSIFNPTSPRIKYQIQTQNVNFEASFQNKQNLYPFVFTSERNNEERVQDILENSKIQNQKPNKVDNEVQNILENLIKKHYNNKVKLSSKQQKNSGDIQKNDKVIFPQNYLKPYEITISQEAYLRHIQNLISNRNLIKEDEINLNEQENLRFQKDYAENIKTLRLEQNKIIDLKLINENEDQNSENTNQDFENNQQLIQIDNIDAEYQKEIGEIIQSEKNIKSFMRDRNFNQNSSLFSYKKFFSLLFLVFEIVFMSISLVLYQSQVKNTIIRFQMYNVTHLYFANTQHIIEGLFNLLSIDKGSYYNYDSMDYQTSQIYYQKYLKFETIYQYALDDELTILYLNNVGVTQKMQDLYINNRNMNLLNHFNHKKTTIYPNNLYQSSQQILAKIYHLKRVPLGQLDYNNNDIIINLENFSNQLLNQIIEYRDLQEQEIYAYLKSIQNYLSNILFIGLIFILAYLILVFILYFKTLFHYYEVPSILTTIPFSQIRYQIKKCENFLSNTLQNEEDDNLSNQVQELKNIDTQKFNEQKQSNQQQIQNSKISNPKTPNNNDNNNANLKSPKSQREIQQQMNQNNTQNQEESKTEITNSLRGITSQKIRPIKYRIINQKLIIPFFFQIVLFSVFIAVDTSLTYNFTDLLQKFYQELTYSVKLEPNFMLFFNCLKSQTITNNYIGVRQVYEPIVYFTQNINQMYDLMDNLTLIHYNNYKNLPSSYQIQFDSYFSQNPTICTQLNQRNRNWVNLTECENFLQGKISQGMNINIGHLITQMIEYSESILNKKIDLPFKQSMNSQMYEIQIICNYLTLIMRELNNLFVNGIKSLSETLNIQRVIVSVTIYSLLFCTFLFVSIPIIEKIKNIVFSQRQLFCLIPKILITQNIYIKQYFLKSYLSNSKK
ncbi:hypothetical protein ABPG72_020544 [Tetrahymena utriculariae]